ncbi:MAG: LemA family protein [Clostridia bacterium]|nr:LemA family protein [Clostridia bacterium]
MEIIFIIFILIIIFIVIEYNQFTMLRNKVKHSNSSIDVYLNQRFDLIPNLVETVKAYAKHEQETLSKITELRNSYMEKKNKSFSDAYKLNTEFTNLFGIAESMPELNSSKNFLQLQKALIKQESQLQAARRIYNGDVTLYNTKLTTFPGNIVGRFFKFSECELFEIEEYKRKNPLEK